MDAFWPTFQRRRHTPPDCSADAAAGTSGRMAAPEHVVLPLQDVPEDLFEVFVNTGYKVKAGQKVGTIGKAPRHVAVHTPIAGEVTAIIPMPHPLVHEVQALRISSDGTDGRADMPAFKDAGVPDVWEFFREKGLPLDYTALSTARTILINASEFEPCISSKLQVITEERERFTEGLKILLEVSGARQAVIVIGNDRSHLHAALSGICSMLPAVSLQAVDRPLPDTVQELIRQRAQLQVEGSRTPSVLDGAALIEPALVVAVSDAYERGIPFMEQLVTVAGSGFQTPRNYWIHTGTQLSHIIRHAGGNLSTIRRVALGGPLMGRPQPTLDAPLVKKAHGVFAAAALAFDEERMSRFYKRCACVRCGKCVDVCPSGIPPNLIAELVEHRRFDDAQHLGLFSCLECGLCYYVCPSRIPLVEMLKLGKLNSRGRDSLLIFNSYRTLCS